MPLVLVIDDEFDTFKPEGGPLAYWAYYVKALEETGFKVEGATSCSDAIERLTREPPVSIVLLDLFVSAGSFSVKPAIPPGIMAADWITDNYPRVPVVVFSNAETALIWDTWQRSSAVVGVRLKHSTAPFELADYLIDLLGTRK